MAKPKRYTYTFEDLVRERKKGHEDGKSEALNEIMRALGVEEYIRQKLAEHEAESHNE